MSPLLQPPGQTLPFYGRGALRTSVSACVVTTDASSTGWGATCNGQAASGLWMGPRLLWHINCLELLAVASSLAAVSATAVRQACVGPYGQHCGCVVYQPDGGYTITPHVTARPPSPPLESHAAQIAARCPTFRGVLNRCGRRALTTAHFPRRMATPSRDDPADLESIRRSSGGPVCFSRVLPLPVVFLPDRGLPRTDALAHSWPRALCKYAFPPVSLLAQTLCKVREDEEQVLLVAPFLAHPDLVSRTPSPREQPLPGPFL